MISELLQPDLKGHGFSGAARFSFSVVIPTEPLQRRVEGPAVCSKY